MEILVDSFNTWRVETRNGKNHLVISDEESTHGIEKELENEEYFISVSFVNDEEHWSYVRDGKVKTEAIDSFTRKEIDVNIRMM